MNPPDLALIRKAIDLAIQGRGFVEPNPTVGCVITKDNQIIGQGFHTRYGAPHAEPEALSSCVVNPENSTVYVTLEPCCHTGKKTPPCAPLLIKAKVARVVIGCLDPNPNVNGRGAEMLRKAGIEVAVLEDPVCKQLIAPFYAKTVLKRPYVTLKWAVTRDGAMAGVGGARICITNPTSNACTHRLRANSGAIMVGVKTVNNDDPQLTVRIPGETRKPLRCVLDPFLQIKPNCKILNDGQGAILFHLPGVVREFSGAIRTMAIEPDEKNPKHLNLALVLEALANENVTHLLVEPGPGLIKAFIEANLVDRVWRYTGRGDYSGMDVPRAGDIDYLKTCELGMRSPPPVSSPSSTSVQGEEAIVPPVSSPAECGSRVKLSSADEGVGCTDGGDLLEEFLNPNSGAFFDLAPSADMLLESQRED